MAEVATIRISRTRCGSGSACICATQGRCRRGTGSSSPTAATSTLLVQGGEGPPAIHHLVARPAGMIPDAQVATIEGDNHLLPLPSPEALAWLVGTALAGGVRAVQDVSPHR